MTCQHSGYSFALISQTRHCQCNRCGHQWMILLGRKVKPRDSGDTDSIRNEVTGLEHIEAMRRRVGRAGAAA